MNGWGKIIIIIFVLINPQHNVEIALIGLCILNSFFDCNNHFISTKNISLSLTHYSDLWRKKKDFFLESFQTICMISFSISTSFYFVIFFTMILKSTRVHFIKSFNLNSFLRTCIQWAELNWVLIACCLPLNEFAVHMIALFMWHCITREIIKGKKFQCQWKKKIFIDENFSTMSIF